MELARKKSKKWLPLVLCATVIAIAGLSLLIVGRLFQSDISRFEASRYSLQILDRQGHELQVLPLENGLRRLFLPLKEIPKEVVDTFRLSEDRRFFFHFGVDPLAVIRAAWSNLRHRRIVSGASTITMQLARMIHPFAKTFSGKVKESLLASALEVRYSKRKILELWLNHLSFGSNIQGVAAASRFFFGKDLNELSSSEIASLAVIPRRPSLYDPRYNPEQASEAAARLLTRLGKASGPSVRDEFRLLMRGLPKGGYSWPFEAPHFVGFVQKNLKKEDWQRGTPIRTTLDGKIQRFLKNSLSRMLKENQKTHRLHNGAAVVTKTETGEVLAYLGSGNFWGPRGQIDAVQVPRQPGSTLKPFLYAMALEKGMTAATLLPDLPRFYGRSEIFAPQNHDLQFRGPVRLRVALASSLNLPAVYTLLKVGIPNFLAKMERLGFFSLKNKALQSGVSVILGSQPVTLWELVEAFGIFGRKGLGLPLSWRLGDRAGPRVRHFHQTTAAIISDILSDRIDRIPGLGSHTVLSSAGGAFKTGTADQFSDIWTLGTSPELTAGVWMGNLSRETIIGISGSFLPASLIVQLFRWALPKERSVSKPLPPGVVRVKISPFSGGIHTPYSSDSMEELFESDHLPKRCLLQTPEGKTILPPEYQGWVERQQQNKEIRAQRELSQENSIQVLTPSNGSIFFYDPSSNPKEQVIIVEAFTREAQNLVLFVNGEKRAQGKNFLRYLLPTTRGHYELTVAGERSKKIVKFEVR